MEVLSMLFMIFCLAFLVETLTEFVMGDILYILPTKGFPFAKYVAIAVGVGLCLFYRYDILFLLAQYLQVDWSTLQEVSVPGIVITGLSVGKGSNYLHDVIKKFTARKPE